MRKLLVFANPYSAIDHEGLPSGSFPADPVHMAGNLGWAGARIDAANTKVHQHADAKRHPQFDRSSDRSLPQTTRWAFHDLAEPIELPDTPHYRMGLRCGDLVPGDAYTSAAAGLVSHRDPVSVLAEKRANAIEAFVAERGEEPAFAKDPEELDPWPDLAGPCNALLEQRRAARERVSSPTHAMFSGPIVIDGLGLNIASSDAASVTSAPSGAGPAGDPSAA